MTRPRVRGRYEFGCPNQSRSAPMSVHPTVFRACGTQGTADFESEQLLDGFAWVGVSAQRFGVHGLPGTEQFALRGWDRSASGAVMPENRNVLSYTPAYRAAFRHFHTWLEGGRPPPPQARIEFESAEPPTIRDSTRSTR